MRGGEEDEGDDETFDVVLDPERLTPDDWRTIMDLALQIDKDGDYEGDEPSLSKLKAVVAATFIWIGSKGDEKEELLH